MHSGINKVCVLTQYKSNSLIQHLMQGWTKLNTERGDFLDIIPAQQWTDDETWFQGTADAVYQSLDIIEAHGPDYVIILAGDHIYNMDYGEMLAQHVNTVADFSVACMTVDMETAAGQFGVMEVDESGRIIGFEEKPASPKTIPGQNDKVLASMGIYVVSQDYLAARLREPARLHVAGKVELHADRAVETKAQLRDVVIVADGGHRAVTATTLATPSTEQRRRRVRRLQRRPQRQRPRRRGRKRRRD